MKTSAWSSVMPLTRCLFRGASSFSSNTGEITAMIFTNRPRPFPFRCIQIASMPLTESDTYCLLLTGPGFRTGPSFLLPLTSFIPCSPLAKSLILVKSRRTVRISRCTREVIFQNPPASVPNRYTTFIQASSDHASSAFGWSVGITLHRPDLPQNSSSRPRDLFRPLWVAATTTVPPPRPSPLPSTAL